MTAQPLSAAQAEALERCVSDGGVAVFPTDTVYGIGCDPARRGAVDRLYELKQRPAAQPAAVMFFSLAAALDRLTQLDAGEIAAMRALLPGPVTLLLPDRGRRFELAAAGEDLALGIRVPLLSGAFAALASVATPVLQSSANLSGEPAARRLADIPQSLLEGVDLVLDGGELAGVASTVVDLRDYARSGTWKIVRAGALAPAVLERALDAARARP